MDSLFIYTAKRSFYPGHVLDQTYQLEIALMEDTQSERKVEKDVVRSKGGAMETLYHRADEEWTISFEPVNGEKRRLLKEFLDSTESGESFQAYIYGTEAEPITLKRTDSGHKFSPYKRLGSEALDYFQASITAIEV